MMVLCYGLMAGSVNSEGQLFVRAPYFGSEFLHVHSLPHVRLLLSIIGRTTALSRSFRLLGPCLFYHSPIVSSSDRNSYLLTFFQRHPVHIP